MDTDRFNRLETTLFLRRRLFGTLPIAALILGSMTPRAEAKGKQRNRKRRQHDAQPECPECATCPDDVTCPPPPPPAPTCAEVCGSCTLCFYRGNDSLLCGAGTRFIAGCDDPTSACSSDNDCVGSDRPYCLTHIQPRGSTERFDICGSPGGHCTVILDPQCSA